MILELEIWFYEPVKSHSGLSWNNGWFRHALEWGKESEYVVCVMEMLAHVTTNCCSSQPIYSTSYTYVRNGRWFTMKHSQADPSFALIWNIVEKYSVEEMFVSFLTSHSHMNRFFFLFSISSCEINILNCNEIRTQEFYSFLLVNFI